MKLSISNIGWDSQYDEIMYKNMMKMGYQGLEIAPTRIIAKNPYDHLLEARGFSDKVEKEYQLQISSMQSIWYGRTEKIFGTKEEREKLLEYTKSAIRFAESMECHNLVFGCPKNRVSECMDDYKTAVTFFSELGQYAWEHSTVLAMEANPSIYDTNFINTTEEAIKIVKDVNCKGFCVNLDVGTCIYNEEDLSILVDNMALINHVHISEPWLKKIEKRKVHKELRAILLEGYQGYVSIEMGKQEELSIIEDVMTYIKEMFA